MLNIVEYFSPADYLVTDESGYKVPKEIWHLCNSMKTHGLDKENLFLQPGNRLDNQCKITHPLSNVILFGSYCQ